MEATKLRLNVTKVTLLFTNVTPFFTMCPGGIAPNFSTFWGGSTTSIYRWETDRTKEKKKWNELWGVGIRKKEEEIRGLNQGEKGSVGSCPGLLHVTVRVGS